MMRSVVMAVGVVLAWGLTPPILAGLIGGDATTAPATAQGDLRRDFWLDELRPDPLSATYLGDHRYDDRLADPPRRLTRRGSSGSRPRQALGRIEPADLSADERIDREVLLFTLDDRIAGRGSAGT